VVIFRNLGLVCTDGPRYLTVSKKSEFDISIYNDFAGAKAERILDIHADG